MGVVLGQSIDRSHYTYDHRFTPVEAPAHPSTIRLLDCWRACGAQGGMRMGRDIPSRAVAPFLRDLMVAEPVGDWADARIRLAGFGMAQYFGRDVGGALLSEIFAGGDSALRMLLDGMGDAIAHNQPGVGQHLILDKERLVLRQELTAFPLHAPDGDARWVLISTFNF